MNAHSLASLLSAGLALAAVVALMSALRRVGRAMMVLVEAAAAVGSVVTLVIVFFALVAFSVMAGITG